MSLFFRFAYFVPIWGMSAGLQWRQNIWMDGWRHARNNQCNSLNFSFFFFFLVFLPSDFCNWLLFTVVLVLRKLIFFYSTGSFDIPWMFKDCLDELAKQALHITLPPRKQTLQEGNVSPMISQQQGHVWQSLDYGNRERCKGHKHIQRDIDYKLQSPPIS